MDNGDKILSILEEQSIGSWRDRIPVIYCILNSINNKCYIGSAISAYNRKYEHFYKLKNRIHFNFHLQNAYNKYGKENFEFKIIENVEDPKDLIKREQWFIDNLKPQYNLTNVAGSTLGYKHSSETKEKCRKRMLGNKYLLGHKHSEETKKKISKRLSGLCNPNYGKPIHKNTMKALRKSWQTDDYKQARKEGYKHRMRPVFQYTLDNKFVAEYESIRDAARITKMNREGISRCCNNKIKTSCGYKWKFKNGK